MHEHLFDRIDIPRENIHIPDGTIPAQAVLGGITVLTDLNPWVVSLHLVISLAIVSLAVLFLHRLDPPAVAPATGMVPALACAAERAVDLAKAGQAHPAFSSAMKYYGTELNKRRYEILMSAGGVDALEWESERSKGGARPRAWLRTKANSIEGGTSEVMLGIVAKRILDLPGA